MLTGNVGTISLETTAYEEKKKGKKPKTNPAAFPEEKEKQRQKANCLHK